MVVQAIGQLVLAGIGFAAYRIYRRAYLAVLAASWLALAIYQSNGALSLLFGPAQGVTRQVLSLTANFASFAQIMWLVLGVLGLTRGIAISRRRFAWATALAVTAALGTWYGSVYAGPDVRFVMRVGVRAGLAALAFALSAGLVLWGRRRSLGRWLVAGGFAVYAVDLMQYFALILNPVSFDHAIHLGYVDILAQMMTGLGLVILMLEGERERATAAVEALQATHHQRLHSGKMEALGRMAGGVSHDFNNLLTAMRGHLELALERTEPADPRRVDLEQAWRAAERACHLTQQLLSFSRSRPVGTKDSCDLVTTLRELKPLLHRLVGQTIDLVYQLPEQALLVAIDRTGLEQVIFNLGANARDAMAQGGTLTVEACPVPRHDGLPTAAAAVLRVTDTGCGMDEATKARIFDPFFTTKPPGFGTGLGLAQVYGIIRQAGGHIECASQLGAGTTFTIMLPPSETPLDTLTPAPEPPPAVPAVGKLRDQVILLVDDDPLVRQLLCRSLREHGYTVIEAGDPIEALTVESEFDEPIDLLITDLAMPKLSGTELAARIGERRKDVAMLFITGYSASHTPSPDIELLQKPFAQTTFLARVEKLLASRARTRAPA
jgi:signal transduction histidine kinase